jgi:hypothetical protein
VREDFTWHLMLRAAPDDVFRSLLLAAGENSRASDVEIDSASLTYSPTRPDGEPVGRVRASVMPCPEGSLVSLTPADPQGNAQSAVAVQAESVASLIHELRRHYHGQVVSTGSTSPAQSQQETSRPMP